MHIVALAYPAQPSYAHKRAAKEFYESFAQLIPCSVCREHYTTNLQKMPISPHLDRRDDLFKWTVTIHNEVNKSLGKATMTEIESINFYRRIGARNQSPVIHQDHLDETDLRSMIKGGFIGAGLVLSAAAAIWWINRGETSIFPVPKPMGSFL